MKFTKQHEKALREFMDKMDADGCVPLEMWTSGTGRYTSNRALPPFVERHTLKHYQATGRPHRGSAERIAMEWLERHPRRKAVLVLDREALCDFLFEAAHLREV